VVDIERATRENRSYRRVLSTLPNQQLVVMRLKPGEEIGMEVHRLTDQFIRVEGGRGKVTTRPRGAGRTVEERVWPVGSGDIVMIPQGLEHNVANTSARVDLVLYTIYSPPHHPVRRVQGRKPAE
jgi:mannose-6-phosphate isomerase-like protein (cupin superfamily)